MTYSHTQKGISGIALASLLVAVGVTTIATVPFVAKSGIVGWLPLLVIVLIGAVILVIFSRLTVEVDGGEVRWAFGRGAPSYRLALDEVAQTQVVSNTAWYGYGIRIIPGGMLYNIAGNRAVEIVRRDGKKVRIGTDEPEALRAAIEAARSGTARAT
jgi:hypothetical protein